MWNVTLESPTTNVNVLGLTQPSAHKANSLLQCHECGLYGLGIQESVHLFIDALPFFINHLISNKHCFYSNKLRTHKQVKQNLFFLICSVNLKHNMKYI